MAFGLAEAANLAVNLSLKGNFVSQIGASQKALTGLNKEVSSTGSRAYKAGTQIGTGIKSGAVIAASGIAFLGSQLIFGLHQLSELEKITTQTNAVLKSTKGVAGESATAIRDLAQKYEDLNAIIDDKVIQSGENVLLTFTAIRKDAFEPALKASLDLATAMGEDLHTAALQVGKALQDPTKGITALRRAGVAFSADQIALIKHLQKTGDLLGAQKIILGELGKEFGGSFAAQGKTAEGAIAGIGDAVEDLQKALATALFPTIQKVLPKLRAALADPQVIAQVTKLGDSIASLFSDENIAEGGKLLSSVFETAKAAAPILVSTAQATLGIVKAAVGLFQSLPAPLQQLAVGAFAVNKLTGGLVTNVAGGIVGAILGQLKSAIVNVQGAVVNVSGGVPGVPGVPGAVGAAEGEAASATGLLAGALKLLPATFIATGIIAAAVPIGQAFASALPQWMKNGPTNAAGNVESEAERRRREADAAQTAKNTQLTATLLDRGGRELGIVGSNTGKLHDDIVSSSRLDRINLRDQISKLPPVMRSIANRDLAKADRVIHATGTVGDKVRALQAIERDLKDHRMPAVARAIQQRIDELRRAATIAARQTTQAVKDKDLSVKLNVPIKVPVSINARSVTSASITFSRYYSTTGGVNRQPT